MSKTYQYSMKGPSAALERMREERKKKKKKMMEASSDHEVNETTISVPTSLAQKGKERRHDDDTDLASDSIHLTFPFDASAHADVHPYRKELGKLLWLEDRNALARLGSDASDATIDHIFLGLQGVLHMSENVRELEKNIKELEDERGGLMAELRSVKTCNEELERRTKELQAQLDDERRVSGDCVKSLMAQLEAVNSTVALLTEKLDLVGCEGEILARAEMAREYLDGKAETWDTTTIFNAYNKLVEMRAKEVARVDGLAASLEGLGTEGPSTV